MYHDLRLVDPGEVRRERHSRRASRELYGHTPLETERDRPKARDVRTKSEHVVVLYENSLKAQEIDAIERGANSRSDQSAELVAEYSNSVRLLFVAGMLLAAVGFIVFVSGTINKATANILFGLLALIIGFTIFRVSLDADPVVQPIEH